MKPIVHQCELPDPETVKHLLTLDGLYLWDEDGRDITECLWNFGRTVNMHVDDFFPGHPVIGYVLSGEFDLHVDGHDPTPLRPGMVYLLDPLTPHGVPNPSTAPMLIYVRQSGPKDTIEGFVQEALAEAHKVRFQGQPPVDY